MSALLLWSSVSANTLFPSSDTSNVRSKRSTFGYEQRVQKRTDSFDAISVSIASLPALTHIVIRRHDLEHRLQTIGVDFLTPVSDPLQVKIRATKTWTQQAAVDSCTFILAHKTGCYSTSFVPYKNTDVLGLVPKLIFNVSCYPVTHRNLH